MEGLSPTAQQVNVTFGPGASKIFTSKKRFIVAVSGQRGGKSTAASHFFNSEVTKLRREETSRGIQTVGTTGIICAPTYDMLRTATMDRFFEEYPQYRRYYKEYHKTIRVPIAKRGKETIYSTIFTLSVDDPENLRGKKCWVIWGDEVDIAPEDTWKMMTGRIADHDDGRLIITSTLSSDSWINRLIYQPYLAGRLTNVDIISWPSIERPGFPVEEWNRLKKEMDPIAFARDFEGKFVFESGLVYGDILKYGIIDSVPDSVTMLATFIGLDYGVNHPTAILYVGYGSDQNWYILDEHVSEMMDVDQINSVLSSYLELYRKSYGEPWATYYDPAGGVAVHSISQNVFPIAAIKEIPARVTLVRNFIYQRRVYVLSHCVKTVRELSLYTFEPGKSLPSKHNDDCLDAMGYVIHNGWASVDGLSIPREVGEKSRVALDLEAKGLLKDGVFQNTLDREDYFIM